MAVNRNLAWGRFYVYYMGNFSILFFALVVEKYIVHPERLESILSKSIYRILSLFYVNFCWVIFNAKSLKRGNKLLVVYVWNAFGCLIILIWKSLGVLQEYGIFVAAAIILSMPVKRIFAGNKNLCIWVDT